MRFGLQLAPLEGASFAQSCASAVRFAAVAEDLDFDILIAPQHFGSHPYRYPHALTLVTYLAARTSRWVGTGIVPLPLLNPIDLAEQVLTLAELTGGRCVLGAGLGYRAEEFALFGVARAERAARFEANLAAIRQHWLGQQGNQAAEEEVNHACGTDRQTGAPAGAPVWIGASAPAGIIRAAREADAWLAPPTAGLTEVRDGLEMYRVARRQAGRLPAPLFPVRRDVLVLDGSGADRDLMTERIARRYRTYTDWGTFGGRAAADRAPAVCAGTVDEVIAALGLLQDAVHEDALVIMRLAWPGMTEAEVIDQIRLVGTHIIPPMHTGHEAWLDDFRAPLRRSTDERQADVPARAQ